MSSQLRHQPSNHYILSSWGISLLLVATAAAGASLSASLLTLSRFRDRKSKSETRNKNDVAVTDAPTPPSEKGTSGYAAAIGNTPLVELKSLVSSMNLRNPNHRLFVKMECLNPGGTGKDRIAHAMIVAAEKDGALPHPSLRRRQSTETDSTIVIRVPRLKSPISLPHPPSGGIVVEGTSGSTGISLAALATARGHGCCIVVPDDCSKDKLSVLRGTGAATAVVPVASITNPDHYVNVARDIATRINEQYGGTREIRAAFMNQFENFANVSEHERSTGPEIWRQIQSATNGDGTGDIDAFIMSAGTGGTLSGVALSFQSLSPSTKIILADPPGSCLYSAVTYGVAFAPEQRERVLRRHRADTVVEGIGLDRTTQNLRAGLGLMNSSIRVDDQSTVNVAHRMLVEEGLFVGSSSSVNIAAAMQVLEEMDKEEDRERVIVTVVCDSGQRHLARFWNRDFIVGRGLKWPGDVKSATYEK